MIVTDLVRLELEVAGQMLPCVQASTVYELNGIPHAEFAIAVGRKFTNGGMVAIDSPIHALLPKLTRDDKVRCWLSISPQFRAPHNAELRLTGRHLIFEGTVSHPAVVRNAKQLTVSLSCTHWLDALHHSSMLSAQSHPSNPSDFTYGAIHDVGAGGAQWSPFSAVDGQTAEQVLSDFWLTLKNWLLKTAEADLIDRLSVPGAVAGGPNTAAVEALERFTEEAGNYVKLQMDTRAADFPSVAEAVWNSLQWDSYAPFEGQTFWTKLIGEFAPQFQFAVVPRISDALVVPLTPGLRQTWKHKILPQDIIRTGQLSQLNRPLKALGLLFGVRTRTGADMREPDRPPVGIGGWFQADGVTDGLIKFNPGPRWLQNIIAPDRYADFSFGGGVKPIATAIHPEAGEAGDGPVPPPRAILQNSKRLMDALAEGQYVIEHLQHRQLQIETVPRLDICPGSTVTIDPGPDRFVGERLLPPSTGTVLRVSLSVDLQQDPPQISTNFTVGYQVAQAERDKPGFGIDKPPLWANAWTGAGLSTAFD